MKILIVSATEAEGFRVAGSGFRVALESIITGVGMTNTALQLGKYFGAGNKPDLAINLGLAGSFFKDIRIKQVVNVTSDHFSELGAEDGDDFLPIDALELGKAAITPQIPFKNAVIDKLPIVHGITVNTVHGEEKSIERVFERYHPFVETMEGAAFFMACNEFNIPCVQLRAISNYVERRDKSKWDIPGALKNLHLKAQELLHSLA